MPFWALPAVLTAIIVLVLVLVAVDWYRDKKSLERPEGWPSHSWREFMDEIDGKR